MNKKLNTVLFLLAATVLNLLLLVVIALLLFLAFNFAFRNVEEVNAALSWLAVIVTMFGSIAATFVLYSRIIRWINKKWNLDNYLSPLFRGGRRR
ncbi:MAG: leader peptide processing enzyme [Spirochaetales bacterium]|nr:MAG: leader peptide processing enzyme [Spirochaetales bacterium]